MTITELRIQFKRRNGYYPPTHLHGNTKDITSLQYAKELEERLVELMNHKSLLNLGETSSCGTCFDNDTCEYAFWFYNRYGECLKKVRDGK